MKFWTFIMTLTLDTAIQSFHKAYNDVPPKFGCEMVRCSEDMTETITFLFYEPLQILVSPYQWLQLLGSTIKL